MSEFNSFLKILLEQEGKRSHFSAKFFFELLIIRNDIPQPHLEMVSPFSSDHKTLIHYNNLDEFSGVWSKLTAIFHIF